MQFHVIEMICVICAHMFLEICRYILCIYIHALYTVMNRKYVLSIQSNVYVYYTTFIYIYIYTIHI